MTFPFFLANATPLAFENTKNISSKNEEIFLHRFVQEPHPMGSLAQKKLAQDLRESLAKFGLKSSLQQFQSVTPDVEGTNVERTNVEDTKQGLTNRTGYNVIGKIQGRGKCSVIFGGHYDTKFFKDQHFIGANDGGSSTALLLELARVLKQSHFTRGSLGSCSLYFVLFDGEEALLNGWNDAEKKYNIQDNLYGSRAFVQKYFKQNNHETFIEDNKVSLVVILDMIGHKHQNLYITQGSNEGYSEKFIAACKKTPITRAPIYIEDDQVPFAKYSVPVLHIIDWTNVGEWHTTKDDLSIISVDNITRLGEDIVRFLNFK